MPKTVRRTSKTLLMIDQDVDMLPELHQALPQHATEAALLAEALHVGLMVLAAEAVSSTGQGLKSLPTPQLLRRVRTRLLPTLEFLADAGALPALLTQVRGAPVGVNAVELPAAPPTPAPEPKAKPPSVSQRAAQAVKGLGSGFLDDDEDE